MRVKDGLPVDPQRTPSLKRLQAAFPKVPEDRIRAARRVMRGATLPEDESALCASWVRACYHYPTWAERALEAVSELLEGYGIEAIFRKGYGPNSYPCETRCSYVNMGDTYTATVIRAGGSWRIGSWGDFVETSERRGYACE